MVRGAKRKIMVRIARACGDLSLQHCDGFGELSAIGEMLCPRQSEGDRVPRTASDRLVRGLLFRLLPYPNRMRAALRLAPLGRHAPLPKRFKPLVEIAPRPRGALRR